MSKEFSQDQTVNHEAIVAEYAPEMVEARDVALARFHSMKEKAKALEADGTLPPRLGVVTNEDGVMALYFGHLSENFSEALKQHRTDRALVAMALELDGVGLTGSDILVISYDLDKLQTTDAQVLPTIETPAIRVDWDTKNGDENVSNSLSFYRDGYVETSSGLTRTDYVYPPNADDITLRYGSPTITQEVDVLPALTQPAEVADIKNALTQVENTGKRYGVTL
jgi:hypothetical protein